MASVTRLMTVEEFRRLPEDSGPVCHELRHGEVVAATRPKLRNSLIQRNLRKLLEPLVAIGSYVDVEVAYHPLAENALWVADVAYTSVEPIPAGRSGRQYPRRSRPGHRSTFAEQHRCRDLRERAHWSLEWRAGILGGRSGPPSGEGPHYRRTHRHVSG